jgi:glycosyltransferase involved in cell wall biosynthesis
VRKGFSLSKDATVGVVIATLGVNAALPRLFESLANQSHAPEIVVVVDQSSTSTVTEQLSQWIGKLPLIHITSEPGLSRARNVGMTYLQDVDVVAICDDDAGYDSEAFARAVFHLSNGWSAVSGVLRTEGSEATRLRSGTANVELDKNSVWRNSIESATFLSRQFLDAVGDFDASLGLGALSPWQSGEGTDLLIRGIALGLPVGYSPEVVVFDQPRERSPREARDRKLSYARGTGRVFRSHYGAAACTRIVIGPVVRGFFELFKGKIQASAVEFFVARGRIEGLIGSERLCGYR